MGRQQSVGKRRRGTCTSGKGSCGADVYCIACTVEEGLGVVVGILGSDLDVKGRPRRLGPNGPSANGFHHEMIDGARIHREEVCYSGLRPGP